MQPIPASCPFLDFFFLQFIINKSFLVQSSAGLKKDSVGFRQGSANYLGSKGILRGSWPHGPPSLVITTEKSVIHRILVCQSLQVACLCLECIRLCAVKKRIVLHKNKVNCGPPALFSFCIITALNRFHKIISSRLYDF